MCVGRGGGSCPAHFGEVCEKSLFSKHEKVLRVLGIVPSEHPTTTG